MESPQFSWRQPTHSPTGPESGSGKGKASKKSAPPSWGFPPEPPSPLEPPAPLVPPAPPGHPWQGPKPLPSWEQTCTPLSAVPGQAHSTCCPGTQAPEVAPAEPAAPAPPAPPLPAAPAAPAADSSRKSMSLRPPPQAKIRKGTAAADAASHR
jgi:hypothetical protein